MSSLRTHLELVTCTYLPDTAFSCMLAACSYKRMKKELGDIEAEVFVLAHTEEVLAAMDARLTEEVKRVERQQGVAVSD